MNTLYTAYITRNDQEYEVTAELYDHGESVSDYYSDTGYTSEITKEPKFHKFYAECSDSGEELILTQEEVSLATQQMIEQYWDEK